MNEYSTVQGDTWDMIAKKVYGDEKQLIHLMKANPSWIQTVIFSAGVDLEIPILEGEDIPSELPPWKRGNLNVG